MKSFVRERDPARYSLWAILAPDHPPLLCGNFSTYAAALAAGEEIERDVRAHFGYGAEAEAIEWRIEPPADRDLSDASTGAGR